MALRLLEMSHRWRNFVIAKHVLSPISLWFSTCEEEFEMLCTRSAALTNALVL